MLYTNVALRNWKAFEKLGTNSVYMPGGYHTSMNLDLPVSIGGYECSQKPEEPIVVPHDEDALQTGPSSARPAPYGPDGTLHHDV